MRHCKKRPFGGIFFFLSLILKKKKIKPQINNLVLRLWLKRWFMTPIWGSKILNFEVRKKKCCPLKLKQLRKKLYPSNPNPENNKLRNYRTLTNLESNHTEIAFTQQLMSLREIPDQLSQLPTCRGLSLRIYCSARYDVSTCIFLSFPTVRKKCVVL